MVAVLAGVCIFTGGAIQSTAQADSSNSLAQSIEGTVELIQPAPSGQLDLQLSSGTHRIDVTVQHPNGNCPTRFSRIRIDRPATSASGAVTVTNLDQIQFLTGLQRPFAATVADLRRLGALGQHIACVTRLEGQVLAASPGRGMCAVADGTGVALLEMKTPGKFVSPGQEVILEGNSLVEGDRVVMRDFPVVDNDDTHGMIERSGGVFLSAGKHPFELLWFNWLLPYGLEVDYEGPEVPRQTVPDSALFHMETGPVSADARMIQGLRYRCYEGSWLRVPEFDRLTPVKEGTIANFDTSVITRDINVGLQFAGYIEVPREGIYTFSTKSDDGSLMYVDEKPPWIQVTGTNALPAPAPIIMHQSLGADQDDRWSEAEGTVTFAGEDDGMLDLELTSDAGQMRVSVADSTGAAPQYLLKHEVRATGISLSTYTTEGQRVAGTLVTPGMDQIQVLDEPEPASGQRAISISGSTNSPGAAALPVLATVEQIKQLNRHEWDRGYPVKLRGVITAVLDSGFFIHDASGSIYARWHPPTDPEVPRVGDFWEITGTTFAEFAPNIRVQTATYLGRGTLPEPIRPTWDQLINGSLDTDYIEVPGIVTAVDTNGVTLLTRTGKISIQLPDFDPLNRYEGALIRIRGCVVPARNFQTQQIELGQFSLINATVNVDEPAPANPFSAPLEHASDLLMFDPRAGALQRIKIAGQIIYKGDGEYFLMDGHDGVRFFPKTNIVLQAGDLVQVVGYPELGGPSPLLREAIVRQVGTGSLPLPHPIEGDSLFSRRNDSTLVQVQAHLTGIVRTLSDQVLELQTGTRGFVARLKTSDGLLPDLSPGSLLQLTGVYAGQGGDLASGREIDSFDLLLNSSADITVLARPSWWTLRHMLTILGAMAVLIIAAMVWITLLHKRVEERSSQLAAEVRRREQTERQRELETERARIARDLHDDLGATLTQIRFLSAVESRDSQVPDATRERMGQISEKSHEMVASLDEIVWAVNPVNDSLPHLANYLCHFAEEFFRPTPIRCRLDVDDSLPQASFTSEVRHNLYLAVREAMNNVSKHSQATEAWLRIRFQQSQLRILVEDNGCGFTLSAAPSGEGLGNMRQRLEKIGGHFEIKTQPQGGTVCEFRLPVDVANTIGAEQNSTL
ncbi:MAG TPA: ATP-binding protein [Verrucomicrobiae bacterium]